MNGQRDIIADQLKSVEGVFFVGGVAGTPSQGNRADQFAPYFERADALEEFRRYVPIRTQKYVVGAAVQQDRPFTSGESVNVPGEQRNQRRFGHQRKALRIERREQRWPFSERE